MFGKNELVKKIIEWCQHIGVDPMLLFVLIILLLNLVRVKDIKNWNEISTYSKFLNIVLWFSLLLALIYYII